MLRSNLLCSILAAACIVSACLSSVVTASDYDELLRLQEQLTRQRQQTDFDAAEQTGKQMVALSERSFKNKPELIADCLDQLISVYDLKGACELAEPYCRRAIEVREKALGKEHPSLRYPLLVLGSIYRAQ